MSPGNGFRVAAVQMVSAASVDKNLAAAEKLIGAAASGGASLVALPEYFCFMGHRDTDKLSVAETPGAGPIQDFLSAMAGRHRIWLVGGTLPLKSEEPDRIYNATLVYGPDGRRVARYDKVHLFSFRKGEEAYDESVSIRPGEARAQTFEWPAGRAGLSVCYDLRFPELYRAMGDVSLIFVPAAFTYTTGAAHWEVLLRARAVENQCYVLAPAQGGRHENGRRTWGHSMLVDPWGEVVECLPEGEGHVGGVVDSARLNDVRLSLPALRHRRMAVSTAETAAFH
jgi:predicted amidohydrolase